MLLSIDYRENKILDLIVNNKNYKKLVANENYEKENLKDIIIYESINLNVGDFIIKNNIGEIEFIIERKSVNDLSSSIIDNRFRLQKERLLESIGDSSKIIYIIEGNKKSIKNLPEKTINSAIINLIFKHKYKVIFTLDYQDTLNNITLLYKKVNENEFEKNLNINLDLKLIKKSDKINENIMVNMLSVIPGVSVSIAKKIHAKWNTLKNLMEIKVEELSELQIAEESKIRKRKLGKVLAIKIINSLII